MTTDDTVSRDEPIRATTDLMREIRTMRAGRRRKEPFRPTLYSRVGGLVRRYGLDEAFLRALDSPGGFPRDGPPAAVRPKPKAPYAPPLFFLSTEREHRVTTVILEKVTSPYLAYATSPDEILLCERLFGRAPSLPPETLACHHFETLMPAEEDAGPG
jgi:hypothetical protein